MILIASVRNNTRSYLSKEGALEKYSIPLTDKEVKECFETIKEVVPQFNNEVKK